MASASSDMDVAARRGVCLNCLKRLLTHSEAAIHRNDGPCDIGSVVVHERDDHMGQLFGKTESAHRHVAFYGGRIGQGELAEKFRRESSWEHAVDRDARSGYGNGPTIA